MTEQNTAVVSAGLAILAAIDEVFVLPLDFKERSQSRLAPLPQPRAMRLLPR